MIMRNTLPFLLCSGLLILAHGMSAPAHAGELTQQLQMNLVKLGYPVTIFEALPVVGGMLRVLWRMLLLYARSPAYRKFVKGVREGGVTPENLEEYFGYGFFVGRK